MRPALERWLAAGLFLWGVGVQSVEALASAGVAMTFLGVVAEALVRGRGSLGLGALARAWLPLVAFVGWALLAPPLAAGWPTGTGLARLADWLAIPVAARALALIGTEWRRRLAWACGVTFGLSCALAALQHFGLWPSPEAFAPLAWTRFPFHRVYEPVPGAEGRFMAGGLLSHRLKFAHVGGLSVLCAVALGLRVTGRERVAALALAAIGFLSILLFPMARMASAALAVSVAAGFALSHRRWRRGLAVGLALSSIGVGVGTLSPALRARFTSALTAQGSGDRQELLATGLRAVKERPIVGVGLGRFRPALYARPDTPEHVRGNAGKAHNQLLSIAAEIGIPGLVLFLGALVALGRSMRRESWTGAAGLSALVFFLALSMTHDPLFQAQFSMALALVLGVALAPRAAERLSPELTPARADAPPASAERSRPR